MKAEEVSHREWIRYGALVLLVAVVVDVVVEFGRASGALQAWICSTTPTPAGPQTCQAAFLLRWVTARLPLYVIAVGAAALIVSIVSFAMRRRRDYPGAEFAWNRLLRVVAVIVCLIALAELVACAGDATCGLSVSCT